MKVKKIVMINLIFGLFVMTNMVGLNAEAMMDSQKSILAAETNNVTEKIKMDYDFDSLKNIKAKLIENKDEIKAKLIENKDDIKVKLNNVLDDIKNYLKENVSVTDMNKRLIDNLNKM